MGGIGLLTLFRYNWQVRDEWFDWCDDVPYEELVQTRIGGMGDILKTLWHVVDVEYSWIRAVEGKSDLQFPFEDYTTVDATRLFSDSCRGQIQPLLEMWDPIKDSQIVQASWRPSETITAGEVLRHVIAHEIHHVGQLSVWAREVGREPVSSNLIGRDLT